MKPALIAKFLVAVAGAVATAITAGLLAGNAAKWAAIAITVVTAAAVYLVPNSSPVPTAPSAPQAPSVPASTPPAPPPAQ